MRAALGVGWALGLWAVGCAHGTGTDSAALSEGVYDLATVGLEASCPVEDGITQGQEFVGKVMRVALKAGPSTVQLETCDPFFDDYEPCFSTTGDELSLIVEGDALFGSDPNWIVPGCGCFDEFSGERRAEGVIVSEDSAELRWHFTVPTAPESCWCDGWSGCTATVEQRLSKR